MNRIKNCPIQVALYNTSLYKKWTLTIIRDLLFNGKHFSDFLRSNPDLSSKVLAERLRDMETEGLINKNKVSDRPVIIEYSLTTKGRDLNKILYELSIFGSKYYTKEVFGKNKVPYDTTVRLFGKGFKLDEEVIEYNSSPNVIKQEFIDT